MVGADTPNFEVSPFEKGSGMFDAHQVLPAFHGIHVLENMNQAEGRLQPGDLPAGREGLQRVGQGIRVPDGSRKQGPSQRPDHPAVARPQRERRELRQGLGRLARRTGESGLGRSKVERATRCMQHQPESVRHGHLLTDRVALTDCSNVAWPARLPAIRQPGRLLHP